MDDIVTPLIVLPSIMVDNSQEVYDDYFGQRIRGSEIIPSDVQQFGNPYG